MKKNRIGRIGDHQELFEALSNSKMYSDYLDAFGKATGVPLILHQGGECKFVLNPKTERIPFCTLMAHTKRACAECYKLSSELEPRLAGEARALYCFAGLCEAEIPVRLGKNVIGFLQTGQVLLSDPSRKELNRIAKTLLDWGTEVDLKRLEEYYFSLRVLSSEQYHSLLRLLSVFAEHLAACANRFRMERKPARSGPIVKAKRLVQERFQERVSLKEVAAAVNVSATYFSRLFRQATGMTFVDFVARLQDRKGQESTPRSTLADQRSCFRGGFPILVSVQSKFQAN